VLKLIIRVINFWKYIEIKTFTEILVIVLMNYKVAEHFIIWRREIVKFLEGIKKDNAGMSNDK